MSWNTRRELIGLRGMTLASALLLSLGGCILQQGLEEDEEADGAGSVSQVHDSGASARDAGSRDSGANAGDASANGGEAQYLIFGTIYGAATADCPEGANSMFSDAKDWYTEVITGSPADTYQAAADALKKQMMKDLPGQRSYNVESSAAVAGRQVSHIVVIQYAQTFSGWFCRPQTIARGYGVSYNSALAQAVASKDANGGKNVSYQELGHVTWTPAPK